MTWPRFGAGSRARADTFSGIGMDPAATSGTAIAGMPAASGLAYWKAFGAVTDRLMDDG